MTARRLTLVALAAVLALSSTACGDVDPSVEAAPERAVTGPQGRVGQFVVECGFDRLANEDPIVHPGHHGASHLHAFFGAVDVDAASTYDQLTSGSTTCDQALDTASYWAPALLDADGGAIEPIRSVAYYRAGAGIDATSVVAFPAGLQMVAGEHDASEPQPTSVVAWSCGTGALRAVRPPDCSGAPSLRLIVTYPDCWTGTSPIAPDHKSHMAYSTDGACPRSHPVSVPQLQFAIDYPPVDPDGLSLASGDILTGHADFWNTWHQGKLEREVAHCIGLDVVCGVSG